MNIKKIKIIICFLFLSFIIVLYLNKYNNYLLKENNTEIAISNYYSDSYNKIIKENYIAILRIPKISLNKGLYNKESKQNNIKENIAILKESKMPDDKNSFLFLAAHSGNSEISFFNDIDKLSYNDLIYLDYNNMEYCYKVVDIYLELKTGQISLSKEIDNNYLVLTTCSQKYKGYQLVVLAELKYNK